MNSIFLIDYLSYILFRVFGALIRRMPLPAAFAIGGALGDFMYTFDRRHRQIAYANLKRATPAGMSPWQRNRLVRTFYRHFGQSIIEVFLIPRVDEKYFKKYITVRNVEYIARAFEKGKGVIFTGIHEGSWELYNIITANLGFPFHFLVRDQSGSRYSRVVKLLNRYRSEKGCRLIVRTAPSTSKSSQTDREWSGIRELISVLKRNEAIGMSVDQGGKAGINVSFFGKDASMASGALRLASKYGAVILPAFFTRNRGPYSTIILDPPFEMISTGNEEEDLRSNLQRLFCVYEGHVRSFPAEYLWTYKTWKYSRTRSVLILSDGKAGHVRQSQGMVESIKDVYRRKGLEADVSTVEVAFKNRLSRRAFMLGACFSGKYACQGCQGCLKYCLTPETYGKLLSVQPDVIVSCGSALAGMNYVLAKENGSRSVVCMKPSFLPAAKFDLVVMPAHDRPARRRNVVVTDGALNMVDGAYLEEQTRSLIGRYPGRLTEGRLYIGVLVGGSTKGYTLTGKDAEGIVRSALDAAERLGAELLVTTSRRTPKEAEDAVRNLLGNNPRCAVCVMANERNIPEAVGGILGLSSCVVTTPDSISMVSEAMASGAYVIVAGQKGLGAKHRRFIKRCVLKHYVHAARENREIGALIEQLLRERPVKGVPTDRSRIRESLEKIL